MRHLSLNRKTANVDSKRMTCTLIAVVVFFLIGELPNHIMSKKAAFVFLSDGDISMINTDELDVGRGIGLILGTINCPENAISCLGFCGGLIFISTDINAQEPGEIIRVHY
ncbi:hypothetical protein CBL_04244 [Carabus blaptoides fortunei]